MPRLRNPHDFDLFSTAAGVIVPHFQSVVITDEQAAKVPSTGVWEVLADSPGSDSVTEASSPDSEAIPADVAVVDDAATKLEEAAKLLLQAEQSEAK
jgi:hypothetical protein